MNERRYEQVWRKTQDEDGRTWWRSDTKRVDRAAPIPLDPMTSIAIRARNRQPPPQPGTPEHFYRNERFGHIRDTDPLNTIIRRER